MGYLFLGISLLAGAVKGYCGKRSSGYVTQTRDAIALNLLRMLLCVLIGFVILAAKGNLAGLHLSGTAVAITALSGVCSSLFVVFWLLTVKCGAYMQLEVFLMAGMLIPMVGSAALYDEGIAPHQWIGFIMLLAAAAVMCSYNRRINGRTTGKGLLLLVVTAAFNGLTDFSQKIFVANVPDGSAAVFSFYTYVFAAAVLALVFGITGVKKSEKSGAMPKKAYGYVVVMAVCLFAYSLFKTTAAAYLPAAQMYPLSQGASLILSSVMAAVLFKERMTRESFIGVTLAFAALLVMNCWPLLTSLFS